MTLHTDITLPIDISNDIKRRRERGNFNFSSFCVRAYRAAFMDDIALIQNYNNTMKLALDMKKEIEERKAQRNQEEKEYNQMLKQNPRLEVMELRFLVSVKRKVEEDQKYIDPNYRRYCNTFRFIPKPLFIKKLEQIDLSKCKAISEYNEYQQTGSKTIVHR